MQEAFKVWVDRLKEGQVQKIEGSFDSSFLEVDEENLRFPEAVAVRGEAYLADQHLVIRFSASTKATLPCAICNQLIDVGFFVKDFYHTEALEEIRDALFDFGVPLREALLLEAPYHVECNQGHCPERSSIAPYLAPAKTPPSNKREKAVGEKCNSAKEGGGDIHFPFANL